MIFRTITDESTGATKSIGLFGKSLRELKDTFSSIKANGIIKIFFNTPTIDTEIIRKYNSEIEKATVNGATMAEKQQIMKSAMEGTNKTTAQLIGSTNGATVSTKALIVAQKQSTLASKAATVATKALAMAGNMIAMWAITKGIELVVKGIDELAHSAEHCKERVDELMSSYQSALDKANSNAKTVEDLASRYEELSKGVNNLGEIYGLTTEEATEYHEICNQIADMFPTLISGYDSEGNAILSLKGNVEQLRDAYREAQQEAYNMLIVSGKDSDGNDIIKNWENLHGTNFFGELFDFGATDVGGKISAQDAIKQLKAVSEMSAETYRNLEKVTGSGTRAQLAALSEIEKDIGYGTFIYKALGIDGTVSDKTFEEVKKQAKALAQTYQAEIDSSLHNVQTLANAYLMTNEDYAKLDELSKSAASIIVNSLNENIASSFKSKIDVGTYVNNIIQTILSDPNAKDALIGLFTLDTTDLSPTETNRIINQYISYIADILNENPVDLKVRLGFDDVSEVAKDYQQIIQVAAAKSIGQDYGFNNQSVSREDMAEYNRVLHEYEAVADELGINTQEEIDRWREVCREAENAVEAEKKYIEAGGTDKTYEPLDLDSFKDTINSIESGYKSLLSAKQEYEDNGGFLSPSTISSLTESGLVQYLEATESGIRFNTDAYLSNTEAVKANAIQQLYNAMCHDVEAIAIGNTSEVSAIAKTAMENAGIAAVDAGNNASDGASGWYDYAASVASVKAVLSDDVQGASGNTKKQIDATIKAYQNMARMVDNINVGKSVKTSNGSSSAAKAAEDATKKAKDYIEAYMKFQKQSLESGRIDYNTYCNSVSNLLKSMYDDGKISAQDYHDYIGQMLEEQKSVYDKALSAVQRRYDKEIGSINAVIDGIEKQNDALEEQKSLMESAVDAVVSYYDSLIASEQQSIDNLEAKNDSIQEQIDKYDSLISVADKVYSDEQKSLEEQQNLLQDKIDALNDENDALDLQYRKEQALIALHRTQTQRTKKVKYMPTITVM